MTQIDPALLLSLTSALQTPVRTDQQRRQQAAGKAGTDRRPEGSRSEQLVQLMRQRVQQLKETRTLSDEDLLMIAVQETLALEFGEDIAAHPRFMDVTRKIHKTLASEPEFR